MAYKQQLGRGKINSFSAFEAKGLIEGGGDDPMVTAETKAINRRATINTIKDKLTPDFSGLGGRLSKKVSQMKPGVMRNVALNVSNTLMGKKPNPSDTQMVSKRKANKEKEQDQTITPKKRIDKRKALEYGLLAGGMSLPVLVKKIADAKKGKIPD